MPLRTEWPLPLSNRFLDALIVESKPSLSIDAVWRRNYDHESHRDGNCCRYVFLHERCGSSADGCSGGCAEQQPGISASRADAGAGIGQCIGIDRGVGAEPPSERFIGEWHDVQRRAEFASRFEEVQAG